jgi:LacI family transcriptional regulator
MAVAGWDDVLAARYISPALTTVRQPIRDLGRLAFQHLQARIAGDQRPADSQVVPTQVIVRSSCGCPPLSPSIDS